uniref:Uncharacterized protein n=1 Tax=Arundo donax TaxID=35708 RepID=A0A0A8ZS71_ARUDO
MLKSLYFIAVSFVNTNLVSHSQFRPLLSFH